MESLVSNRLVIVLKNQFFFIHVTVFLGIEDYEGGIVIAYGTFSRLHVFKALNHHEIVQNIVQCATQFLGIDIKVLKSQLTLDHVERERFGKYRYWHLNV